MKICNMMKESEKLFKIAIECFLAYEQIIENFDEA
jgi:hypothetical protein